MGSEVNITNARILSSKKVDTQKGSLLSVLFSWSERVKGDFVNSLGQLTLFSPEDAEGMLIELNSQDKVNLFGMKLHFSESKTWKRYKVDDDDAEEKFALFPEFRMYGTDKEGADNVEIVERGDPTGRPKGRKRTLKPEVKAEVDYPITDGDTDNDLPF